MNALDDRSLSRRVRTAETKLRAALREYAAVLSAKVDGLGEEAAAAAKRSNAIRLELMLPRYRREIHASVAEFTSERGVALESDGMGYLCGSQSRTARWPRAKTVYFGRPDEEYLELLRKAMGPAIEVWVEDEPGRVRVLGSWRLLAKWSSAAC